MSHTLLESEFAGFNSLPSKGMVACSSGTAALHLALESLNLPRGSGVIVPEFTMVACARAVTLAGLVPVFVDCGRDLLIDPAKVQPAIDAFIHKDHNERNFVSAIMPVHIYGRRCNMDAIVQLARANALEVIEDLAEAHGVPPHLEASAACWSFYKNKIIAGEEGGIVYFKDGAVANMARQLRSLGMTAAHDFLHVPRGHNYRLADTLAWLVLNGRDGLHNYKGNLEERRELETQYEERCPQEWRQTRRDAPWVYDIRIPALTRKAGLSIVTNLNSIGIAARHSFKPMTWQPEYMPTTVGGPLPYEASMAALEVLYLPLRPYTMKNHVCLVFDELETQLEEGLGPHT